MNLNSLLSQALNSDLIKKGSEAVKQSSSSGNLQALGAGAVGGGLVGLLMGSKKARKVGKKVAGVGGAAALGALAFKVYRDWQSNQSTPQTEAPANQDFPTQAQLPQLDENQHSVLILKAMVAAAKADGHIDDQEQQKIQQAVSALGADDSVNQLVTQELSKPLDPSEVARSASTPELASEIYLASLLVVDEQNFMEKAYLKELATQLNLAPDLVLQLEQQIQA